MDALSDYTKFVHRDIMNILNKTNSLSSEYSSLSDEQLTKKTDEFRKRLRDGESIESIKAEALAVAREAIYRRTKPPKRAYDVQIEAAASMDPGVVAEMKTGEGKTLVQILSSYLYALEATKDIDPSKRKSVHIMTSNEYLAFRDKSDNEAIFSLLGLSCGYAANKSQSKTDPNYRKNKVNAYNCDIVYGTATTIAFDYLDDNKVKNAKNRFINKPLFHAIVDEADDILLDQATTPLIINGTAPAMKVDIEELDTGKEKITSTKELYIWATKFVNGMDNVRTSPLRCYVVEKSNEAKDIDWEKSTLDCVVIKETGEVIFSEEFYEEFYDNDMKNQSSSFMLEKAITNAILAKYLFPKNVDYIVEKNKDGYNEIKLISETTGRVQEGSKYTDGMQEAIEAKEALLNPKIPMKYSEESLTVAKCTYSDFLSLYETGISGMTGTSDVEEFNDIYGLKTYKVPTNKPSKRIDCGTEIYATKRAKYEAIAKEVLACYKKGQPVLIGTTNGAESNEVCAILKEKGIVFQRLDAVNRHNENDVKNKAGQKGMITVATNMAGRGIDINLGEGVKELGGLYVIGTSKNNNIRIDNQLRGRAARQGEVGQTKFFQSLEDDIMLAYYGSTKLEYYRAFYKNSSDKIPGRKIQKISERAQRAAEGRNKEIRKYNEEIEEKVYTKQKNKIYEYRNKILDTDLLQFTRMLLKISDSYVEEMFNNCSKEAIIRNVKRFSSANVSDFYSDDINKFKANVKAVFKERLRTAPLICGGTDRYLPKVKSNLLDIMDAYWVSHMYVLEDLKNTASMYGYTGQDPIAEYEKMANKEFHAMDVAAMKEMFVFMMYPNLDYEKEVEKINASHKKIASSTEKERGRSL